MNRFATMNLDNLLEDSAKLERTISALIENNAIKQGECSQAQTYILEKSQYELDRINEKERELRNNLEALSLRKNTVEAELKQYTDINEKLSHWVASVQKTHIDKKDKNQELYVKITETIHKYAQIKSDFCKAFDEINNLNVGHEEQIRDTQELVKLANDLVVTLHRNEKMTKVLEQQNKFSEQQFDLILNALPWEPLTNNHIEELRNSDNEEIRAQTEYLQIQAADIQDLNEALNNKKERKLELLEQLSNQLNLFVQKREEATLIDEHSI